MQSAVLWLLQAVVIGVLVVPEAEPIDFGRDAVEGEFPWHAAVFNKPDDYLGGGTLITARFVVTSTYIAVYANINGEFKLFVKLGVHNLESPNLRNLRTYNVLQVHRHSDESGNYIALLELTTTVEFSNFIQPACIYQVRNLKGESGLIPGWGGSNNDQILPRPVPRVAELAVVKDCPCSCSDPNQRFDNIICVGGENSTGLCAGDYGNGMVFNRDGVWYLGAVTTYQWLLDKRCMISYSELSKLYLYLAWLKEETNFNSLRDKCGMTPGLQRTSKALSHNSECGVRRYRTKDLIVAGQNAKAEDWPWHVTVYHEMEPNPPEYACGASLIHQQFVLTVRHCTCEADGKSQLSTNAIFVRMGVQRLYTMKEGLQQHSVLKIHYVRDAKVQKLRNDIALLELRVLADFTDQVHPICLPTRDVAPEEAGTVVGFGFTEELKVSRQLKMASMPVIEDLRCVRSDPGFGELDEGLFCAGHTNGTTVCNGDSGGGLVFLRNGIWELGGMVSFAIKDDSSRCRHDQYAAFTRVYRYLPWIRSVLEMT